MTSFNLHYFFKGAISRYGHILRSQRPQQRNLGSGRDNSAQNKWERASLVLEAEEARELEENDQRGQESGRGLETWQGLGWGVVKAQQSGDNILSAEGATGEVWS